MPPAPSLFLLCALTNLHPLQMPPRTLSSRPRQRIRLLLLRAPRRGLKLLQALGPQRFFHLSCGPISSAASGLQRLVSLRLHSIRSLPRPERGPLGRVWPMPVPFPSLHRPKANRRQADAARKLGLNALVLVLSWLPTLLGFRSKLKPVPMGGHQTAVG